MPTSRTTRLKSALHGKQNPLLSHTNVNFTGNSVIPRVITQKQNKTVQRMESPDATEIEQRIRFKSTQGDDSSYPVFNKTRSALRFNKQSGTLPTWVNSGRVVDYN